MNASEAFAEFVMRVLVPGKARRFAVLSSSKKGQRKVLNGLCHEFDPAIRDTATSKKNYSKLWDQPCYVFHARIGFGACFPKVRDAYDELSLDDSWLILLRDASAGIYRPEWRWDDEKLIIA
jgi:hypothetical protein